MYYQNSDDKMVINEAKIDSDGNDRDIDIKIRDKQEKRHNEEDIGDKDKDKEEHDPIDGKNEDGEHSKVIEDESVYTSGSKDDSKDTDHRGGEHDESINHQDEHASTSDMDEIDATNDADKPNVTNSTKNINGTNDIDTNNADDHTTTNDSTNNIHHISTNNSLDSISTSDDDHPNNIDYIDTNPLSASQITLTNPETTAISTGRSHRSNTNKTLRSRRSTGRIVLGTKTVQSQKNPTVRHSEKVPTPSTPPSHSPVFAGGFTSSSLPDHSPSIAYSVPTIAASVPSRVSEVSGISAVSGMSSSSTRSTSSLPLNTVAYSQPALPATTRTQAAGSAISRTSMQELNESLDTIDSMLHKRVPVTGSPTTTSNNSTPGSPGKSSSSRKTPVPRKSSSPISPANSTGESGSSRGSSPHSTSSSPVGSNNSHSSFLSGIKGIASGIVGGSSDETGSEAVSSDSDAAEVSSPVLSPVDVAVSAHVSPVSVVAPTPASKYRDDSFHGLFPKVPASDRLLDDFSCALSREILLQGRLYVTQRRLCFYSNLLGWITTLVLELSDVERFERRSTAGLFPNGISVIMASGERHIFASFLSRDSTLSFLLNARAHAVAVALRRHELFPQLDASRSSSGRQLDESDILTVDDGAVGSDSGSGSGSGTDTGGSGEGDGGKATSKHAKNGQKSSPGSTPTPAFLTIAGPLTHPETDFTPEKPKFPEKVILDCTLDAPLGFVFQLLFGRDTSQHRRLMEMNDGFDFSDYGDFYRPQPAEAPVRRFTYQKRLNFSIGPKATAVKVVEYLCHVDTAAYAEVLTVSSTPNVPSGGAFDVRTRYLFTWGAGNCTRVRYSFWVNWTSSSWIKGIIERSTMTGQKKCAQDLQKLIESQIPSSRDLYKLAPPQSSQASVVGVASPELGELPGTGESGVGSGEITEEKSSQILGYSPVSTILIGCVIILQILIAIYLYHVSRVLARLDKVQTEMLERLTRE